MYSTCIVTTAQVARQIFWYTVVRYPGLRDEKARKSGFETTMAFSHNTVNSRSLKRAI